MFTDEQIAEIKFRCEKDGSDLCLGDHMIHRKDEFIPSPAIVMRMTCDGEEFARLALPKDSSTDLSPEIEYWVTQSRADHNRKVTSFVILTLLAEREARSVGGAHW